MGGCGEVDRWLTFDELDDAFGALGDDFEEVAAFHVGRPGEGRVRNACDILEASTSEVLGQSL